MAFSTNRKKSGVASPCNHAPLLYGTPIYAALMRKADEQFIATLCYRKARS
jgi:hypothetical protein